MSKNPIFSIIVPIYNTQTYLKDCIESILNQTFDDFELILIDDGSTDDSGKICDKYAKKDKRIKYMYKENGGQATARNIALDMINGKYIIFIDSDDWIYSNYLERCSEIFKMYNVDMISFPGKLSSQNRIGKSDKRIERKGKVEVYSNFQVMESFVKDKKISTTLCTKVYKKQIWDDIRFPKLKCREDAYIMHELISKCEKVAICEEDYYFYYLRNNSTEHKKMTDDRFISIEIGKRCAEFYKENYLELYPYAFCNCYIEREKNMMIEIISKNALTQYKQEYKAIYTDLRKQIKYVNKKFKKQKLKISKIKFWARFPYLSIYIFKLKKKVKYES